MDSSKHERSHLGASVYPWYKSRNHCPIWKKKIVPIGVTNPTPKLTKGPRILNYEKGRKRSSFPAGATDITLLLMCS